MLKDTRLTEVSDGGIPKPKHLKPQFVALYESDGQKPPQKNSVISIHLSFK